MWRNGRSEGRVTIRASAARFSSAKCVFPGIYGEKEIFEDYYDVMRITDGWLGRGHAKTRIILFEPQRSKEEAGMVDRLRYCEWQRASRCFSVEEDGREKAQRAHKDAANRPAPRWRLVFDEEG